MNNMSCCGKQNLRKFYTIAMDSDESNKDGQKSVKSYEVRLNEVVIYNLEKKR